MMKFTFLLLVGIVFTSCATQEPSKVSKEDTMDVHSFAQPDQARTTHLDLDIDVDFDTKVISGTARHTIEASRGATQFIMDTRGLNIIKVTVDDADAGVTHQLTQEQGTLGRALVVPINSTNTTVTVYYFTSPDAEALGWLDPEQTADKTDPFLYTQGQAILTRSWIPIQDSPGIRFTYDATVRVPEGMLAVMSASNPTEVSEDGEYTFEMDQPIPAYLMALAAGKLEFAELGPRTGIYAEPSVIESAEYEFSETENMVSIAEDLYGPYLWERYDMIVLPPSFPFGGMENPRLTFLTPTVIAGDRSLVSLIAHELAHSWSGNLVTNATWNDFWLNEGFTVYFEWRIMEALYGDEYTRMLMKLGKQDLESEIDRMGPNNPDSHLFLNLEGRNPDDGMTSIAYDKGALFLKMLEEKSGRKTFDAFLRKYFDENKFQTMSTTEFVEYLNQNLIQKENLDVNVDEWIYGPGLPTNTPVIASDRFEKVDDAIDALDGPAAIATLQTDSWTTHEWLHFIRHLPSNISIETLRALDGAYGFAASGNSEIAAVWYETAIRQGYGDEIMPQIDAFLVRVGRRKFLMPIYRAMTEADMLETARDIYTRARPNYHAVSRQSLDNLLDV